ncbi:MAG: hypothetical protein GC181_03925 [Bacteroidetes bacterium]|nr:hypothetical protein [Bacteroidota bacterium]
MDFLQFASIDIGSNAIRFLLCYVFETEAGPYFRKGILLRVPLRLGEDAFRFGRISIENEKKLISTMHSFRHLMDTQTIVDYRAYATSAMRDAANTPYIVEHVERECGIKINVISGEEEANVISGEEVPSFLHVRKNKVLFVDVGGGSTELTFHSKNKSAKESFNIGTIRSLHKTVEKSEWSRLHDWLHEVGAGNSGVPILGSGGNINKIYKIKRRRVSDLHITTHALEEFYNEIKDKSDTEKIINYQLNPDRSDVIVPASEIFLDIINITGTKKIYVPKTGLSDGIVRSLYEQYKASQTHN